MADQTSDLLMYINMSSGGMVPGEAMSDLSSDSMMTDFTGSFMQLKSFSFGVKLSDKGSDEKKRKEEEAKRLQAQTGKPASSHAESHTMEQPFAAFYDRQSLEAVPVELTEISIERNLDAASAVMWNWFQTRTTIPSAAIAKRRVIGGLNGQAYMKIAFTDLLIVDMEWEESDVLVVEKTKLICRAAQIYYTPQLADGTLGVTIGPGWGYLKNAF